MAFIKLLTSRTFLLCIGVVVVGCLYQQTQHAAWFTSVAVSSLWAPSCENAQYAIRILSYDPVIIHVENFFTVKERKHMLDVAAPMFERSKVKEENGTERYGTGRTSSTAYMPREDPVSQCIYARVSQFQGHIPIDDIEYLQLTTYRETQQFRMHYDWFGKNVTRERVSTFFGILEADCDNCGTHFPDIRPDWSTQDPQWCRFVDCSADSLTVLPIPGSAVFWRNVLPGTTVGDRRTRHAGLPLSRGHKTGINIWTTAQVEATDDAS